MSLKSLFRGIALKAIGGQTSVLQHFGLQVGSSSEATDEQLIEKIRGWSWTCIDRNAKACAQVPLRLYKVAGASGTKHIKSKSLTPEKSKQLRTKLAERVNGSDTLEEVTEHQILDLLRNVNPNDNAFDLKELTVKYLEAIGVDYWWLEKGVGDEVINIWPLMSQHVEIVLDKEKKKVVRYDYHVTNPARQFKPEDIVHFKYTSMTNPLIGDSPTRAGVQSIDLNEAMNQYEIASFRNGGNPSMVMEFPVDSALSPDEKKRIKSDYKNKVGGIKNTGKVFIASGGAKVHEFGHSPKDMNFMGGRQTTLEETCGVYGVPLAFVKPTEMSRANLWASLDLYMNYTINPKLVMIEQKINEQFTPNWGEGLFLLFDDARPDDPETRLKEIQIHLTNKYSSINEERAIDGKEPVAWGDTPVEAEPIDVEVVEEPKKAVDVVVKREGETNNLPDPDFMPNVFRINMVKTFIAMESEIIRNLKAYGKPKAIEDDPSDAAFAASADDIVSSIYNEQKWADELAKQAAPFIDGLLTNGLVDAMEKVKPDAIVNTTSPAVLRSLDERAGQIKSVATTVQKEIRDDIAESINLGESRSRTIKRVRTQFNARHKADRVVRTETIWAHNQGSVLAWEQSGVVSAVKWDTVGDDRLCPYCASMDGKTKTLGGKWFEKGSSLTVTGSAGNDITMTFGYEDIKHPPLHPNCRCQLIPILIDD